ncbi:MAG: methyltransferase domain-containing protein [Turneriella sp.]
MKKIIRSLINNGVLTTLARIWTEVVHPLIPHFSTFRNAIEGKKGIEVGGPSYLFSSKGFLPVYRYVAALDNVNFGNETIWEGTLVDGGTFRFEGNREGRQYVREASNLTGLRDSAYDFLISSHVLEHCANPIKALLEWKRVVCPDGHLILVVPHKEGTFDRKRKTTEFNHLLQDYANSIEENDLTHAEEFIRDFDFSMHDDEDRENFRKDILNNLENRRMHHHVFTSPLVVKLVDHCGFQIVAVTARLPGHIVVLARKCSPIDNSNFLKASPKYCRKSPFKTDQE